MLNQYTFLDDSSQITMRHIRSYRKLLIGDELMSGGASPESTVPGPIEIHREINTNGGVIVLNNSGEVVGGSYITQLPEFQKFQMGELGGTSVLISERHRGISNKVSEILLSKNSSRPLYSVVRETISRKHAGLWHTNLKPDQLGSFFQSVLAAYGTLDGQIILANEHANVFLTSEQ